MRATIAPACLAADTNTKLTPSSAKALAGAVFAGEPIKGVCRYVSITQPRPHDIDFDEAHIITDVGLAYWLIQHPLNPGWAPTDQLGAIHGVWAARNAIMGLYPSTCHLGIDLEGCNASTSKQAVIDYVGARVERHLAGGFPSVLYCGFGSILSSYEEFADLPTVHLYWGDFQAGRHLPVRGFIAKQFSPDITLAGIKVDLDRIFEKDNLGGQLVWAVSA